MTYKYEIRSLDGRLWDRTLTRIKAARIVANLKETKDLDCVIVEAKFKIEVK